MIEQVIRQTKKRLGLFSPRRLGSPPPELPNYSRILGLVFSVVNVTLVIGFCRNAEGDLKSAASSWILMLLLLLPGLASVGSGPEFRIRG